MKKYLLLFLMCVYASIGAWAGVTYSANSAPGGSYADQCGVFTPDAAGDLNADKSNLLTKLTYKTNFIVGPVNEDDIKAINDYSGTNDIIIDLTLATGLNPDWLANLTKEHIAGLGLPDGSDLGLTNSNLKVVYSTSATGAMTYSADLKGGTSYEVNVTADGGLSLLKDNHFTNTHFQKFRTFNVYGTANYTEQEMIDFKKLENIGTVTEHATYGGGNEPYTVSGCDVIINMTKAEAGQILADLITLAKKEVTGSICTLTVTGELTANDLIALGGTNMTGATRIDLSGATLASGVSIDNLQIPSSLEELVLPKDQTFSVGLKSKLTAATNLKYAYTPSSDCTATGPNQANESNPNTYKYDETKNTIADYVWVNKAGGLAQALEKEEQLRNSFYIKVASGVALTATDINFGALTNKPTNYLFLDLSESIMTSTVADSYTVEDDIPYRIILPNNWSNDDLAHFQNNTNKGNLAAVYSYEDTKLNILVINDNSYLGTALQNPRIVRPGTNAIEILPGIRGTEGPTQQFGTSSTQGKGILTAINNADSNIKSVYISIGNTASNNNLTYTFTNPYITYLSLEEVKCFYSGEYNHIGPAIVISGANSLETLNLKNGYFTSVTATGLSNLKTVDLAGTEINGATNLSNTKLQTFTTNSSTKFAGALNLASTDITSFATQAKIAGDISLNDCSSLTSVDISSTQFQNSTSKIHVHATDDESDINVLSGLNTANQITIQVPAAVNNVEFDKTRIHPNDNTNSNVLDDNIAAAAASGEFELDDHCKIEYDGTTGIATVTSTHPGCFSKLMAKNDNYLKFPQGTTFKFTSTCQLNENDLKSLCGYNNQDGNNVNDMAYRSNYYYVDLYDVPASSGLCDYQTGVITNTINWMRQNDRQFKGLILPKDHTLYGSGISLISDGQGTQTALATCSEFIAYYKTQEMVKGTATNLTKTILFTHVYNQSATNSEGIQASNDKLTELLTAHGLNGAGTNAADLYSVSTNGTTPFDATALVGSKGYIETFNNEMVGAPTQANIYAYPKQAGEYTTFVGSSSIGVTPTEVLKIAGTVSDDASAVAKAFNTFANGPRVLDLSEIKPNDDTFLKGVLESLTNDEIEYIILPAGKSKELVCNTTYSASMTKLKAVISTDGTNLVAYVKQAGSLAEARYLATGGSVDANTHMITPAQTGLQSVTLAGNLNAADIAANTTTHHVDASGHWVSGGANATSIALSGEQGTITTIDLKDAVFEEYTPTGGKLTSDMNFSYAGLGSIRNITLPTSKKMTLIPEECFMGITSFNDLCIPYNYTKIDNKALNGTYCGHITTTDANGAVIDNGARTYTFSKNLEEIGSEPEPDANGVYSLSETVFPQNRGVTDVYVLAHKVPKCYANAFPANMLYGWGGFKGSGFPYCREKYDNSADGSLIFTVLHFPDEASFNASSDPDKESSYEEMKKLYTDVNKIYTKKEQTGAVDANGDEITWPTFSELRRTYNQATNGMTWNDWVTTYDTNQEVNGGDQIPTKSQPAGSGTGDYSFANYEGWHQFTLALATYVEPDETVKEEKIIREYVDAGWFTICIPFDMTVKQVTDWLGVPASEGNIINKYNDEEVTTAIYPDIRQLYSVTRKKGNGSTPNKVTFRMSNNLFASSATQYLTFNHDASSGNVISYTSAQANSSVVGQENSRCLVGGRPYLIKIYKRKGESIPSYNIGAYIMTHYNDQFKQSASCIYNGEFEQLGGGDAMTLRFAKPFEDHKIQAMNDTSEPEYLTYNDGGTNRKYHYTFVGQFWDQDLPRYCFYQSKGKWYRNSSVNSYKWSAYKCVIMATPYIPDSYAKSGKYRDALRSNYPTIAENSDLVQGGTLKIGFADGRDDDDFAAANAKYIFTFDDFVTEFDDEGNETTTIDKIDGVDVKPLPDNYKVYNMAGQYVGNSINGLGKGLYIVNGKKIVVQ